MLKTVHLFWSGWITAEVMEVTSAHGVGYSLAIHRVCPDTGKVETLMTVKGPELHNIRAVADSGLSLIEHLLDGGSHRAWCERRGFSVDTVPAWNPPTPKEPDPTT